MLFMLINIHMQDCKLRFYFRKLNPQPPTLYMLNREWNFSDDAQAREFSELYRKHMLAPVDRDGHAEQRIHRVWRACTENFEDLKDYGKRMPPHEDLQQKGMQLDLDNTVCYVDRGKPTTVVAMGGGGWYKTLYEQRGLDHQDLWAITDKGSEDYNIVSVRENVDRCYRNPIAYDSCYYQGLSDEMPSLPEFADYVRSLFPNTEYYVIGDCKHGHSTALFAYYLNASKVFLHSPITSLEFDDIKDLWQRDETGAHEISHFHDTTFGCWFTSIMFADIIPQELKRTQNIIDRMSDTRWCFWYHSEDTEFLPHAKHITPSKNVEVNYTNNQKYTLNSHHITNYLRKYGIIWDWLKS